MTLTGAQLCSRLQLVEGYLLCAEGYLLYTLARQVTQGCIVEIGSYRGRSTICLGWGAQEAGRTVYAIDPHTHYRSAGATYGPDDQAVFDANIAQAGLQNTVIAVPLTSAQAAANWTRSVALLFIDGLHEYEHVYTDFSHWTPHIMPQGIVVFHDSTVPGVLRVFEEMDNYECIDNCNTTSVWRKR